VNRTRLKVSDALAGLSLLEAELVNHRYESHFHPELVLAIMEFGAARINCWGEWFLAKPGDIFLSNPNDPQAAISATTWKYRGFYLTDTALNRLAGLMSVRSFPRLRYGVFQSPRLARELRQLHTDVFCHDADDAVAEKLIWALQILIRERRSDLDPCGEENLLGLPSSSQCPLFKDALGYLIRNQSGHCDLDSLSIHLGLSHFQVVRLFNRRVGMPPHAFLVQLRLAKACRLLRAGAPIAAAAVDSGFFDQSALTRHFRRSLGVTPRQFQDANRARGAKR
jgi:AraC-like DNA-binding protein